MYLPISLFLVYTVTAAEHKRLVLHSDLDISAAFGNLQQNLTDFGNKVMQLESKIGQLESENIHLETKSKQHEANVSQLESEIKQLETDRKQQDARVSQLESENIQLETKSKQQDVRVSQLESENQRLGTKISQLETSTLQNGNKGAVYVRWGRNTCPGNGTELIYKGIIGGTVYTSKGGASNSLCLPENPTWNKYEDGFQGYKSAIYGTEIEDSTHFSTTAFGHNYNYQDPPCSVCYSSRENAVMIPGRSNCYPGWTVEYTGYLVGGYPNYASSNYICLDSSPEKLPHGLDSTSNNQHVLYFVEAHCGSLPCPPYHEGREIACVVCSK